MQKYAHDMVLADARPFHKQSRARSLRFLLPRLALVLLVATITGTIAIQSAYACNGGGQQGGQQGGKGGKGQQVGAKSAAAVKASGKATIQLQGTKATLNNFSLSGGPSDVGLIIHIHGPNTESALPADKCKGPVLFVIENPQGGDPVIKTDANGAFSIDNKDFTLAPPTPGSPAPDLSKIGTWYVNVHDATKPLPIPAGSPPGTKPKFASIACGLINVGSDPTIGTARLKADGTPPPTTTQSSRKFRRRVTTSVS